MSILSAVENIGKDIGGALGGGASHAASSAGKSDAGNLFSEAVKGLGNMVSGVAQDIASPITDGASAISSLMHGDVKGALSEGGSALMGAFSDASMLTPEGMVANLAMDGAQQLAGQVLGSGGESSDSDSNPMASLMDLGPQMSSPLGLGSDSSSGIGAQIINLEPPAGGSSGSQAPQMEGRGHGPVELHHSGSISGQLHIGTVQQEPQIEQQPRSVVEREAMLT